MDGLITRGNTRHRFALALLCGLIGNLHAQEAPSALPPALDDVATKPVFPGCESFVANSPEAGECIHRKVSDRLHRRLRDYFQALASEGSDLSTSLTLLVDQNGKIAAVHSIPGNSPMFDRLVLNEMKAIASTLPNFVPALDKKGQPTRFRYRLPVRFLLQP